MTVSPFVLRAHCVHGCVPRPPRKPAHDILFAAPYALPIDEEELMEAAGRPLLTGWKEIAHAVGNVSVRTAQRWERTLGLPVGRAGRTAVADPEEIRKWKERQRNVPGTSL
ncbi:MAG: hypothetical protein MUC41_07880 [Syntrophobacteraceae bacterium]|nr:hypothetical protein [Syntrophobacteraceae bacterium]